jgi:hypothetical protein
MGITGFNLQIITPSQEKKYILHIEKNTRNNILKSPRQRTRTEAAIQEKVKFHFFCLKTGDIIWNISFEIVH